MQVKVTELKEIAHRLIQHLEELGIEVIEIDDDYYWSIPKEELYNPYKKPESIDIGQLSDDWEDLQKLLMDESDVIAYNLVDFAAILRVVGERVII